MRLEDQELEEGETAARLDVLPAVHNPLVSGNDLVVAMEAGLRWSIASTWSSSRVLQAAATRFFWEHENPWNSRIGVYPGVGYWFGGT